MNLVVFKRRAFPCLLVLLAASAVVALPPEKFWQSKPAGGWSEEEAKELLIKSPWAVKVEILQQSGRQLARFANGQVAVYRTSPENPPRVFDQEPMRVEQEFLRAVYGVRWSSAQAVQDGLKRLEELSPVIKGTMAPPAELSPNHYVVTVRVITPPEETTVGAFERKSQDIRDEMGRPVYDEAPRVADILSGLDDAELKERAELATSAKLRLKPEKVMRHGVGTGEGFSFFFPRTVDGRETLPPGTAWAEFVFEGRRKDKMKARFNLKEMIYQGKQDY
ncbi:MAG TPA: hypothetical protein VNN18_06995 [Candidatus Xenobia bacterium]|nr:hypothetical protein [Candidatus Xenobia bacterium]